MGSTSAINSGLSSTAAGVPSSRRSWRVNSASGSSASAGRVRGAMGRQQELRGRRAGLAGEGAGQFKAQQRPHAVAEQRERRRQKRAQLGGQRGDQRPPVGVGSVG